MVCLSVSFLLFWVSLEAVFYAHFSVKLPFVIDTTTCHRLQTQCLHQIFSNYKYRFGFPSNLAGNNVFNILANCIMQDIYLACNLCTIPYRCFPLIWFSLGEFVKRRKYIDLEIKFYVYISWICPQVKPQQFFETVWVFCYLLQVDARFNVFTTLPLPINMWIMYNK